MRPLFVYQAATVSADRKGDDFELAPGDDQAAIAAWLNEFKRRPNTLRSYGREAARFWLWLTQVRQIPLASVKRRDLDAYRDFLASPPAHWIPPPKPDASQPTLTQARSVWTPLKAPMNEGTIRQTLVILQSMMTWLLDSAYLTRNPARLILDKGPTPSRKPRSVPSAPSVIACMAHLRGIADHPPALADRREQFLLRRDAFVWSWIYLTAARRNELATALCGSVTIRYSGTSAQWWWDVDGKGGKKAPLPIGPQVIELLSWYLGCTQPELGERLHAARHTPLLRRYRGDPGVLDAIQVWQSVKRASAWLADQGQTLGLTSPEIVAIAAARPHSLRAFRNTHLLGAKIDPRHVQRLMRHADFNTTLIYDHTPDSDFHAAIAGAIG